MTFHTIRESNLGLVVVFVVTRNACVAVTTLHAFGRTYASVSRARRTRMDACKYFPTITTIAFKNMLAFCRRPNFRLLHTNKIVPH